MMLLVIDVTKGIQTQTAECLVIGEILTSNLIVVLNKVDKFDPAVRAEEIEKLKKKLRTVFASTKFGAKVPMVCASAAIGGGDLHEKKGDGQTEATNIKEVVDYLLDNLQVPVRNSDGPFLFYFDHGFRIGGQGTVLTGTVISGKVKVGQTVEIPTLKMQPKVKSMQVMAKLWSTGLTVAEFLNDSDFMHLWTAAVRAIGKKWVGLCLWAVI